jgi:hypothetical protein
VSFRISDYRSLNIYHIQHAASPSISSFLISWDIRLEKRIQLKKWGIVCCLRHVLVEGSRERIMSLRVSQEADVLISWSERALLYRVNWVSDSRVGRATAVVMSRNVILHMEVIYPSPRFCFQEISRRKCALMATVFSLCINYRLVTLENVVNTIRIVAQPR